MKFSAKLEGLLSGLSPVLVVSETGAKNEYPDALKTSLTVSKDGIIAEAHNGNVAARSEIATQTNLDYHFDTEGTITVLTKQLTGVFKSFDLSEILNFELKGGELEIRPQSDIDKLQTVQTDNRKVEMPIIATNFSKTVVVSKELLSQAIKNVVWAVGTEKLRPIFFYWVLRFKKTGELRSVAGDGGRFIVDNTEGSDTSSKNDVNVIIFKEQNPALLKVLEMVDLSKVEIKEFVRNPKDTIADHIVFSMDTLTVILVGHDSGVNWPHEDKYVNRAANYRFVTDPKDWDKEFKGVLATVVKETTDSNDVHVTTMTFDSKKKILHLKADGPMRAQRKVKILDSQIGPNLPDTLEISVETANLRDMVNHADGMFQFELEDDKKPVVVRYFADQTVQNSPLYKVNKANNTKEQYLMFFAAFNKQ